MRVVLLESHRESLKECFVKNVSAYESAILRTITFCVSSSNNSETFSRFYILADLLKEDTFAFKNRL